MPTVGQAVEEDLGRVLVIGGTGFVGTHCLRDVLKTGGPNVQVYTFNRQIPEHSKQVPNVTYLQADLGDAHAVTSAIAEARPNVIIHLASPKPFIEPRCVYERVNIQGIKNVLTACDQVGTVKALVYCSSVSVIDDGVIMTLHGDESWPVLYAPRQREFYWHSKALAETLVLGHNGKNPQRMLTTALRVTSVFGEDDEQIIGGILQQAKTGGLNVQFGEGKNRNCWTYVGTVTGAHIRAARCLLREGSMSSAGTIEDGKRVGGEVFYITNDDPRPFWAFARQVAAEAGYPVRERDVWILPGWVAGIVGYISEWVVWVGSLGRMKAVVNRASLRFSVVEQVFSMEKAKRVMGFVPTVSIDDGIRRSVASFKDKV